MFKTKIIKHISRIAVVLILLLNILTLVGCSKFTNIPNKYLCDGQSLLEMCGGPVNIVAGYDTNIFDKSDITFNLAYSTHTLGYSKEKSYGTYGEDELYFALYISPAHNIINEYFMPFYEEGGLSKEELQNIDNFIFVKGITEEEAFSDEYACKHTFLKTYYNHIESITIPWDYFDSCDNEIRIILIAFYYSEAYSGFRIVCDSQINVYCKEIDGAQVKLNFEG